MMKMIKIISNVNTEDEQVDIFEDLEYIYTDYVDKTYWLYIKQKNNDEFAFEIDIKKDVFIIK